MSRVCGERKYCEKERDCEEAGEEEEEEEAAEERDQERG